MEANSTSRKLWDEFAKRVGGFGENLAIVAPDGEISFADLLKAATKLAETLGQAGVQEGDIVGLSLPNGREFVIAYLALCRLAATTALITPKYQTTELQPILDVVHPNFILTALESAGHLTNSGVPGKQTTITCAHTEKPLTLRSTGARQPRETKSSPSPSPSPPPTHTALALIKFTSGSTGIPKGIGLDADNLLAEAANIIASLSITPQDKILTPVSLSHSYGFDLAVLPLLFAGARIILRDQFVPRLVLRDLHQGGSSIFLGVPSMYRLMLAARITSAPELSSVRYLLSCTAPLYPETITAFHRKFNGVICQHYGSSETGAATTHLTTEVLNRATSVGRVMEGVTVTIVDPDGRPVATGVRGEVIISSEAVACRYVLGGPIETSPLQNGRYRTGDSGRLDQDGFLYLDGRLDQLINVGGHKVAPEEVTRVLENCPKVDEAAVIGAQDQSGEEVVYAVVTVNCTTEENEILRFCRERLAEYKVPRRLDIRREMPRSPTGKIQLRAEDLVW